MNKLKTLFLGTVVWAVFFPASRASSQEVYWVEGEASLVSSWVKHGWFSGQRKTADSKDKLVPIDMTNFSGKNWATHWSKNPGECQYRLELPAGEYTLWVRCLLKAHMKWKLDAGPWQPIDLNEGLDPVEVGDNRVIAWKDFGKFKLESGPHTLAFRAEVSADLHKDNAFAGIDCLALATGDFKPTGSQKPAGAKTLKVLPPESDQNPAWFDFTTKADDFADSALDVSFLLDKPAGKHGPLGMKGGQFAFADGKDIKFLGTNICSAEPGTVPAEMAKYLGRKYAKYGINAVRFHKFTYRGMAVPKEARTSTELDPKYMDNMDFLFNEFKKNGIYVTWSPIYGHQAAEADGVLAFKELSKGSTAGLVNFAPDLQDVHIRLLTNLLEHKNAHTGLRYADDPALAFIEIQNEDDIFWNYKGQISSAPTYQKMLYGMFSDWLKAKYGNDAALRQAWGEKAMNPDESLDKKNIEIVLHGWWYSEDAFGITKSGEDRTAMRNRTADAALFLHETQNKYYARVTEAIRKTGYKGLVIGSCWGSGGILGQYYNLRSDALVGFIDRHNYYGGGGGHRLSPGAFNNASELTVPGSGLLGTGLQRVKNLPFTISEWLTLLPTMWVGEGQAILGAYGLGLQNWNGIFMFGSTVAEATPSRWDAPRVYTADQPLILGVNPALAFWIHRGDIKPGAPAVENKVCPQDLKKGIITLKDNIVLEGDVKEMAADSATPGAAFAVGTVSLEFTDTPQKSVVADLSKFWDKNKKVIHSNTGELTWDYSGKGYFTLNTAKSKAVCGFVQGKDLKLGEVEIKDIKTRFIVLYLSSIPDKPIPESNRLLIIAMARSRNTGMIYNEDETQVLATGKGPIQMEAVQAEIVLPLAQATVQILDDYGRRTGKTVPVTSKDGKSTFRLEPAYKTVYYEVVAP